MTWDELIDATNAISPVTGATVEEVRLVIRRKWAPKGYSMYLFATPLSPLGRIASVKEVEGEYDCTAFYPAGDLREFAELQKLRSS